MPAMTYTPRDLNILSLTVYGEARGESDAGKLAVAWTARNRAEADLHRDGRPDWWGEGVAGVCLKSWQFSCWNLPSIDPRSGRDRNQSQRMMLLGFLENNDPDTARLAPSAMQNEKFVACYDAARAALNGTQPDPTNGATHYYAPWVPMPTWARGKTPSAIIGHHRFYNDVEPGYTRPARAWDAVLPPVWLAIGSEGDKVRLVQARLAELGAKIVVDGRYGKLTAEAVRAFQAANGLKADGIIGPVSWAALALA